MHHQLHRFLPRLFLWLSFALGAAAPSAHALSVLPPEFSDLVAESDLIVEGQVTAVEARIVTNRAGYRVVKTYVTVQIARQLKGTPQPDITLEFLGGTVGDESILIPGMPTFAVGDRDFLFVAQNGEIFCPLVAAQHGRYSVKSSPVTGDAMVLRANRTPLRSVAQVAAHHDETFPLSTALAFGPGLTAESFRTAIRTEVARSGPTRRILP